MNDHLKGLRNYNFSLDRYDNEPYTKNPLLKFRLSKIRQRQQYELIKRRGVAEKIKFYREPISTDIDQDVNTLPESHYIQQIRDAISSAPIPQISSRMRRKIVGFVPNRLCIKYSEIVKSYMKDVSNNYNETIKTFVLKLFLAPARDSVHVNEEPKPFAFKYLGRTAHRKKFLRHCKILKENLFIPHPFIRYILHLSDLLFPVVLNDFGNYKKSKSGLCVWLMLVEFENAAQRDLECNSIFLKEEWYPKIVHILLKHYRKRMLPSHLWPRILACAKGLINRQITELKVNTFEHIFTILANRNKIPPVKFQAACCNGRIVLLPSFRELLASYWRIFKSIAAVATKFPALEPQIDRAAFVSTEHHLKVEIGDIFMNQQLERLETALETAYASVLEYIEWFGEEFYDLYSDNTKEELIAFLAEPKQIDEYFGKIQVFRGYIDKFQKTVKNVSFDNATLNQTKALSGLRTIAQDYIDEITTKIVMEHRRDCQRICDWFDGIKKRAFEAPKSTETLLANGEFMLQVKNKKMTEIQEHIQRNLRISGRLMDLTELTQDHFDMQVSIVQWLHSINDIFEQNSTQFEIHKNQFEEHLSMVTKKLAHDIDELVPKLAVIDDMYDTKKLRNYHATLEIYNEQIQCFEDYVTWINNEERLFKLPVSQYAILDELKSYVGPFAALIQVCIEWLRYYYVWMDGPFEYLDPVAIETIVDNYLKEFEKTQKYYRNKIKQDMLGNPVLKFRGQTEDPDPEKHPVPLRLCSTMINWIKGFQIGVYIVKIMCNPALRDRHWVEMSEIAGFDLAPHAGTSLRKITKFGIDHLLPSFEIISIGANKELQLQMDLADMHQQWQCIEFPICTYKDTEIKILANIEDIQVLLDDHIIKTLTMRGSAFVKPCEHEVRTWYDKLLRVNRIFDEWIKVQTNWLYLLPILSAKDILTEMPEEERLFTQVNQIYCKYIDMATDEPIVMKMAATGGLLEDLMSANEMLDEIKNGVNAYLERKRLYFPRFFFLSNNEMLQILSETKNPQHVQPYLCKCFDGIHRLQMDNDGNIDAMLSTMKEKINFLQRIQITEAGGSVEKWLSSVENEMRSAIRHEIINGYADYVTTNRIDWILNWPQMIVLVIANIFWTSDVHACLMQNNRNLLSNVEKEIRMNLNDVIAAIQSNGITNLNRITLKSLCILDVNARDVTQTLLNDRNSGVDDFQWVAQLRYYWMEEQIDIKQLNTTLSYGYEYLGNFQRVVVTPLTERCFRTVMLAFQHHLFSSLEGPTATGKSETVKDLAKALAMQLKVFNCSADLDHRSISKFLKGIASSGAWICFEDFNRIKLKTLSVVAQQVHCVIMAVRSGLHKFVFDGVDLNLSRTCNMCIISNPDYPVRSKIPDNLKVSFRPIAMMCPDVQKIAEISLFASGFENAKSLGKKVTALHKICAELLSAQEHYDFGLRNLKMTLRLCGNRILQRPKNESHESLVGRCLLDVNLPKISGKDVLTFKALIADLFPSVVAPEKNYQWLRNAFELKCTEKNFQPKDSLYVKLIETYEMIGIRQGLILIGNPYTGKSTVLNTLASSLPKSMEFEGFEVDCAFINPKAVDLKHLFGEYDSIDLEWTEGIVSSVFRRFSNASTNSIQWIVFDGPMDSEWIENLNTVLDDNKKLCLSSGEIIELKENTSIICEIASLSNASPSTVSRMGIVYFEPDTLEWQVLAKTWMNNCSKKWITECKAIIWDLFEWTLPPTIDYLTKHCQQLINPLKYNSIMTTFGIFQMVIDDAIESNPEDYQKFLTSWVQAATIYSIVWGIGGLLDGKSRNKFDHYQRKIWSCSDENPPPMNIKNRLDITLPNDGNLADYLYVFKQKGAWKLWADLVRRQEPEISQLGIYVATVDTARYSHLIDMHIKYGKNLLLIGAASTGKTFIIQNILRNKLNLEKYTPMFIKFSIGTKANEVHDELLGKLVKLKRGVYGPPKGTTCTAFVDDLNIPCKETHGSQSSIEILRQIFDYGYVYDLKSTRKIYIESILALTACSLPGGSYHDVDVRFLNHFNCFSINELSEETITRIFGSVLMNGLKKNGHATDVIGNVNQMVAATVRVYYSIANRLKPTPAKCHYRFNFRDVLRVCTGCSLLRKESVENKKIFAKIWFHEAMRVFHDRLIDHSERIWVFEQFADQIQESFKDSMDQIFDTHFDQMGNVTLESMSKLIFGSYFDLETELVNRRYEEIASIDKFTDLVVTVLDEYNAKEKHKLDFICFSYALEHLNRICRIISMPGGSGLIIGFGDSGRKTIVRLAALVCKQNFFQLKIHQKYDLNAWKEDIKTVLKSAGGMGRQTVLLLSENQLSHNSFLTDIDHLLSSGDVPKLWPIDEKQELLEMVRLVAQGGNRNIDISAADVFTFFVNRCRQNLHIILCFSPIGCKLRTHIRLYPSLTNCCTIDWFDTWPENALDMVASKFLSELELCNELRDSITASCKCLHTTAQDRMNAYLEETGNQIYITSASYLELIRCFVHLFVEKQSEIMDAKSRYVSGLDTLENAAKAVENMQSELSEMQPKLLAMAENCRLMTVEIEAKTIEASIATEQVKRDELVANGQAAAAEAMEDECSKDLAQAVPVLEDALQALNTLKPADITLVKSMKNPPSAVKLVMAAVCVMKAVPPDRINDAASGKKIVDYWGPSKRILGDMGFLQSLKDYDKDDISPDIMKKIRKDFIPHKDFQPHIVAKASSAAEGLCKWIKAIENFESVNTVVLPKKLKLIKAKENLKETRQFLAEKRGLATELEGKVAGLNQELEKTNREKEQTEREAAMCEQKLKRAEALINSLGQEKSRWTQDVARLQRLIDHLPGDILISSGVIAYLGPLPKQYRDDCIATWHHFCVKENIPCSNTFSLISCLGNETEIQSWNLNGLSMDKLSIENAVIMINSCRQCIFFDPQRQANKWIKHMESKNRLKVVKLSQDDYFSTVLNSMHLGNPVLIEDIGERLDVFLEPIFNFRMSKSGEGIQLNHNSVVTVSEHFRLYLTSNLRNPQYLSDISGKVNVINFVLAPNGLEENLLDIVVLKENPYLREERDQLISAKSKDKALLLKYEDTILSAISESEGDILEDETAIRKMDDSKQLCVEIIEKQSIYVETELKIETFRESYRKVAAYASILYSCLDQLQNIHQMYQFSLDWYFSLYNYSIENANRSRERDRRIDLLIKTITNNFYDSVCRSIFDRDKLLFSWIITTKIMLANGRLNLEELRFFIAGGRKSVGPLIENPNTAWISDEMWQNLNHISAFSSFDGFISSFVENINNWKIFFENVSNGVPEPWCSRISPLTRLLILKIFHPDHVPRAVAKFISDEMGSQFINPPHFDIRKSFTESTIITPLIFILSSGIDPIDTLLLFAKRLGYSQSLQMVSLGCDQESYIEKIISEAQMQGSWVCLQNCHMDTEWLTKLENNWKNMNIYNTMSSFRLWMTSESTNTFPLNLLQNGIKMTYERPNGIKSNLLHLYQTDPINESGFYDGCPSQDKVFKRMLYSLCFFDVMLHERKRYGNNGWNVAYEFNKCDFTQSIWQLQTFLCRGERIPFDTLQYLIGACNYGGRITDKWDFRLLTTILMEYLNENVINDPFYRFAPDDAYILPRRLEHRMIVKYIYETIPNESNCGLYGLHSNADFEHDLCKSKSLLKSMATITNSLAKTVSDITTGTDLLGNLTDIYAKLPMPIETSSNACGKFAFSYKDTMNTVLAHEIERYNRLLCEIRSTCVQLQQAIEGTIILTPELESVCYSILSHKIPHRWLKFSYPSNKPFSSYVSDFFNRFRWFQSWWCDKETPTIFWLSAFFHPSGFLVGVQLNFARKYNIAVDQLTFDVVAMQDQNATPPEDGAYVNGFYLKAAHWNGKFIEDQLANVMIQSFPMVHIQPMLIEQFKENGRYECPLYQITDHYGIPNIHENVSNLITTFWLPVHSSKPHCHWIKRGVSLVCQKPE